MNRPYHSPLREAQAEETRQRIIDATVELLAAGDSSWSVADVAQAAGVATRTVHRYFATREALVDGVVAWINDVIESQRPRERVTSLDDLVDTAPAAFRFVAEHEELYRALLSTPVGREAHVRGRSRRRAELRSALRDVLAEIPNSSHRERLLALAHLLASSQALLFLHDYWDMDSDEAADAVGWALRELARAATRHDESGG